MHDDKLVTTRINADLDERDEGQLFKPLPFLDDHLGHPGQSTSMSIHDDSQYVSSPIFTLSEPPLNTSQDGCRHLESWVSKFRDCSHPFQYG